MQLFPKKKLFNLTTMNDIIKEFNDKFPTFKDTEEERLIQVLKFFGVPEVKEGKKTCIADFLKADRVDVHVPHEIYDQLYIAFPPKKLNLIRSNILTDTILMLPHKEVKIEFGEIDIEFNQNIKPRFDMTSGWGLW